MQPNTCVQPRRLTYPLYEAAEALARSRLLTEELGAGSSVSSLEFAEASDASYTGAGLED